MEKILVVEDETNIRDSIKEILELNGYSVLTAENGESGYLKAIRENPDLIICDIMMPKMNGHNLLTHIRNTENIATTPVIFLSALTQKEDIRKGLNLGSDDYLTKPFSSSDLLMAIKSRLKRHQLITDKARRSEQMRISQDLHDGIQLDLISLKLTLEQLKSNVNNIEGTETKRFDLIFQLVNNAIESARNIRIDEVPSLLKELGLVNSLSLLCNQINELQSIKVTFEPNLGDMYIEEKLIIDIYRIVQESLNNILKHANAKNALIKIVNENSFISLIIKDDGVGFDLSEEKKVFSKGLNGIKKRVDAYQGTFKIDSAKNSGTQIKLLFPFKYN